MVVRGTLLHVDERGQEGKRARGQEGKRARGQEGKRTLPERWRKVSHRKDS